MDTKAILRLSDGTEFHGFGFGHTGVSSGELVFDTTMIGYTEVITDPVYDGKMLILTYPIIGNYGMPAAELWESNAIHPAGIIVHDYTEKYSHWNAIESLGDAMKREKVIGIYGIDTHLLAQKVAANPFLSAQIIPAGQCEKAVEVIKVKKPMEPSFLNQEADKTILMIDLGAKHSFIQTLIDTNVNILRTSGREDYSTIEYDGIVISGGAGDESDYPHVISLIKSALEENLPLYAYGLGYDLMVAAIGGKNEVISPSHRSLGQPVRHMDTNRCFITKMSHNKAVDINTLPSDWKPYFRHLNSNYNTGIIHIQGKQSATTFQPDSSETRFIIDHFISNL